MSIFQLIFSLLHYSNNFRSTLNKKVRNAQLAQYNFIFVIGEKEKTSGKFNEHVVKWDVNKR